MTRWSGSTEMIQFFAGDGDDNVSSGAGEDSIEGGTGDDTINGGDGNDRIVEVDARQNVSATDFHDRIFKNQIDAGSGDDYVEIRGFGNASTVHGGAGSDYLMDITMRIGTELSAAKLFGDDGDDKLIGMTMSGGQGNDRILCTDSGPAVMIDGDEGNDSISVENAYSIGFIFGNDGNDTIESAARVSQVNGNAGDDQITFAGNYASGDDGDDLVRSAAGILKHVSVVNGGLFIGGKGNDTLIGSPFADTLQGGDDADELRGEAGDDWLGGDAGNDVLYGGNGTDSVHGGDGNDSLHGGGYRDSDTSDDGRDLAYGEAGKDFFDPKHRWASTDADSTDQNRPPVYVPSITGVVNSGSVSYTANDSSLTIGGTGNLTIRDTTPSLGLMGRTAVFSGLKVTNLQSTSDPASVSLMPALTASERKSIRPSIIHVPADWNLIRLGKSSGLIWYRIQSLTMTLNGQPLPYSLASLAMRSHRSPDATSRPVDSMHLYSIAVHPSTLFTNDSANSFPVSASNWIASGFDAAGIATRKPMTIAGGGEVVSFKQPASNFLTSVTMDAGKRYLFTSRGLRLVTADGVGAIVS